MSTLPGRSTFSIRQTTSSGVSRRQLLGQRLRVAAGVLAVGGLDRRVHLHALGARRLHHRVQPVGLQPLAAAARRPRSTRRCRSPGPGRGRAPAGRAAAGSPSSSTCHCGTCSSSAARLAAQARSATDSSTHHVERLPAGRAARARDGHPAHPLGGVPGAVLLEERLPVDAVGPAGEGDRPAGQVRQQHRRDPHVVVDHLGLGERRPPGTAPCPGWRPQRAARRSPPAAGSRRAHGSTTTSSGSRSSRSPAPRRVPQPAVRRPHGVGDLADQVRLDPVRVAGHLARQRAVERRRRPRGEQRAAGRAGPGR